MVENDNLSTSPDSLAQPSDAVNHRDGSVTATFEDCTKVELPAEPRWYQIAYHGSKYDFDEFLLSHIGTGEGAQSHGWGLNFALDRKIAVNYRITAVNNTEFRTTAIRGYTPLNSVTKPSRTCASA